MNANPVKISQNMKKNSNLVILILLGIMWSSFAAFTKVSAEAVSPFFVAFSRLAIGGILLYAVLLWQKKEIFLRQNFKRYLVVGFFNSAFPFTLFALSAKHLDSGVVAIIDGAVPMFEVLIAAFILQQTVSRNAVIGIVFGVIGIIVTSCGNISSFDLAPVQIASIIAILVATFSYAAASHYINLRCSDIESMTLATGSVVSAALILSPCIFFTNFTPLTELKIISSLLGLGFFCTGIAYIFYFKLTAEEGPRTAVSVVLLMPVFGTIFGVIFLNEVISLSKIIGCITVLISMKFILNLSRESFFRSKKTPDFVG